MPAPEIIVQREAARNEPDDPDDPDNDVYPIGPNETGRDQGEPQPKPGCPSHEQNSRSPAPTPDPIDEARILEKQCMFDLGKHSLLLDRELHGEPPCGRATCRHSAASWRMGCSEATLWRVVCGATAVGRRGTTSSTPCRRTPIHWVGPRSRRRSNERLGKERRCPCLMQEAVATRAMVSRRIRSSTSPVDARHWFIGNKDLLAHLVDAGTTRIPRPGRRRDRNGAVNVVEMEDVEAIAAGPRRACWPGSS